MSRFRFGHTESLGKDRGRSKHLTNYPHQALTPPPRSPLPVRVAARRPGPGVPSSFRPLGAPVPCAAVLARFLCSPLLSRCCDVCAGRTGPPPLPRARTDPTAGRPHLDGAG